MYGITYAYYTRRTPWVQASLCYRVRTTVSGAPRPTKLGYSTQPPKMGRTVEADSMAASYPDYAVDPHLVDSPHSALFSRCALSHHLRL